MKYLPANSASTYASRITDVNNEYFHQLIKSIDLNQPIDTFESDKQNFILIGFCCDEGVKRNQGVVGAKEGPECFRRAFFNLATHLDNKHMLYDAGNVYCDNEDLESAQQLLAKYVAKTIQLKAIPIVIGGGHETAWGHLQGLYKENLNPTIVNFDAHFDLRETLTGGLGSSGTPFYQASRYLQNRQLNFDYYCLGVQPLANTNSLFDYAHATNTQYLLAEHINSNPQDLSFIDNIMAKHQQIYITLCLDVFQAALAPGVSAPQALGIDSIFVINALRKLKQSDKVVALDIVELNPKKDIDNRTAKLAAALLANFLQA
ncbi:formimidoylglutamase [Cysteiniphilum halobium]|uniref:formimidoylglutamase n=1 Tax=Cysteiniphilum halobium TaxID=2219059 RepID=UPI000E651566|nr:formimidoylglutamase [Cysteiniphilum halobium]